MCEAADLVVRLCSHAVADPGAGRGGELKVPGDEVGVEMRIDHPDDVKSGCRGVIEVFLDVAAGIHDDRLARGFVSDEVGAVGEAPEVVLLQDHGHGAMVHIPPRVCKIPGRV